MIAQASRKRLLIVGGGFGGVYTARRLERLLGGRSDVVVDPQHKRRLLTFTIIGGGLVGVELLETIQAETIILAAGIVPNPVVAGLPMAKDKP